MRAAVMPRGYGSLGWAASATEATRGDGKPDDRQCAPTREVADTRQKMTVMIEGARRRGFAPEDYEDGDDGECEALADVDDVMKVPPQPRAARFPFLSNADIAALPNPVWLIEKVLQQNSLAVLYGQWGVSKSFIALDWI